MFPQKEPAISEFDFLLTFLKFCFLFENLNFACLFARLTAVFKEAPVVLQKLPVWRIRHTEYIHDDGLGCWWLPMMIGLADGGYLRLDNVWAACWPRQWTVARRRGTSPKGGAERQQCSSQSKML